MWNLLRAELLKLRRCQILLVGLVALGLCPLVQYGSQMIMMKPLNAGRFPRIQLNRNIWTRCPEVQEFCG